MAIFGSYRIGEWGHLRDVLVPLRDWVFRGQGDARWLPESSLERTAPMKDMIPDYEASLLREFKRRAHHFIECPEEGAELEWIALMRHYGAPTRLVDVTRSPYVAAYFALEDERKEKDQNGQEVGVSSAIWAFNELHLNASARNYLRGVGCELSANPDVDELIMFAFDTRLARGAPFITIAQPPRMNHRMAAQQGLFLIPSNISRSTMENVFGEYGQRGLPNVETLTIRSAEELGGVDTPAVLRIELPASIRKEAMRELQVMNINAVSIYPDIGGFCKSLTMRLALGEI